MDQTTRKIMKRFLRIAFTVIVIIGAIITVGFQLLAFIIMSFGGRMYYYEPNVMIAITEAIVCILLIIGIIKIMYERSLDIYLEDAR